MVSEERSPLARGLFTWKLERKVQENSGLKRGVASPTDVFDWGFHCDAVNPKPTTLVTEPNPSRLQKRKRDDD